MERLRGKVAVVTGGSSGIGLACARLFAAEGAQVYIVGRRQEELDRAVQAIGGDSVIAVQGDIARLDDLDRLFSTVQSGHGRIDVLLANAAVGALEPLGRITESAIDSVFGVNVKGTVFTVQKALPLMQSGGSIILMGSGAGVTGTPAFSIYSASKAAIRNLARSWALDLKGTGIRVNVLSPGATATPAIDRLGTMMGDQEALIASLVAEVPLGRMAQPEEIASVALFLATEDSRFMTGSEVFVDGGRAQV